MMKIKIHDKWLYFTIDSDGKGAFWTHEPNYRLRCWDCSEVLGMEKLYVLVDTSLFSCEFDHAGKDAVWQKKGKEWEYIGGQHE